MRTIDQEIVPKKFITCILETGLCIWVKIQELGNDDKEADDEKNMFSL